MNDYINMAAGRDDAEAVEALINKLVYKCFGSALEAGWWHNPKTGEPLDVAAQTPIKLALMHSEISEALEADRKDLMDSHLPSRSGLEVEIADLVIRAFDFCGANGLDLGGAMVEKMAYNAQRNDHKTSSRTEVHGKRY